MTRLDKEDVLSGLFGSWEDIDGLLLTLSDDQWQATTPLPGWTVHDVVSHIIGTESFLQGIPAPKADCDVSVLPHVHNEVGVINECWVRHLRAESPSAMLDRFRDITGKRREVLTEMSENDWNAETATPAGPDTYGRFMRMRTFDCWMHEQDIREAVAVWASDDVLAGPPASQTLEEIAAGLGYIVGKLGGAPAGSRIAFELTGPLQRTLRVAVNGRGLVVDDFGGQSPTATIQVEGVLFTRLVGGRTTAEENANAIELSGDTEVAQRIAEHLKFVM
ncbi:MAG: hypothetical protein QOE41_4741 [Mycobacterium sp.]|nr:hypothetical protein [Mycobacterium sp.]MDT5135430.1 hypothetical protein [Mycobacterium sp.]